LANDGIIIFYLKSMHVPLSGFVQILNILIVATQCLAYLLQIVFGISFS